jgi:GNAT superfamily N-acetyltransferase
MTLTIRALDPLSDRAAVERLMQDIADYVMLERGQAPTPALARDIFTDAPPGQDPARGLRLGLCHASGRLLGLAALSFDFPERGDAFLGLLVLAPDARDGGLGAMFLARIESEARARGAGLLYAAVLDANLRGRAFWRRQGFVVRRPFRKITLGSRTQFAARLSKPLGGQHPQT